MNPCEEPLSTTRWARAGRRPPSLATRKRYGISRLRWDLRTRSRRPVGLSCCLSSGALATWRATRRARSPPARRPLGSAKRWAMAIFWLEPRWLRAGWVAQPSFRPSRAFAKPPLRQPALDTSLRIQVLSQMTVNLMQGTDPDTAQRALAYSSEAMSLARGAADPDVVFAAIHARQMATSGPDGA